MSNNTTLTETENVGPPFTLAVTVTIAIFITIMAVLTCVGNLIVIMAFIKERSLRNFSDYLILNLAVSDFIIGFIPIPLYAPYLLSGVWKLGHYMCLTWLVVDYVTPAASTINICMISFDRYLQIAHPLWSRSNRGNAMLATFLIIPWLIPGLFFTPLIYSWEAIRGPVMEEGECFIPYANDSGILLLGAFPEFIIPFFFVVFCNVAIFHIVRKRSRTVGVLNEGQVSYGKQKKTMNIAETGADKHSAAIASAWDQQNKKRVVDRIQNSIKSDRKAAMSLFVIVAVFGVCWTPFETAAFILSICSDCVNPNLFEFFFWMLWINSTINPFLYPFLHTRFRRAFLKLFGVKDVSRLVPNTTVYPGTSRHNSSHVSVVVQTNTLPLTDHK